MHAQYPRAHGERVCGLQAGVRSAEIQAMAPFAVLRRRAALVAVAALTTAAAPGPAAGAGAVTSTARSVTFAGSSWAVKASAGLVGPGPNVFSDRPENVWVDASGRLHLRITYRDGQWMAAEVILGQSLGYGTYRFDLESPAGQLDPNVVLGMFTWSDRAAYSHREIDVELARWGDAASGTNAQYVVQPFDRPGNLVRFQQPAEGPTSHQFSWTSKAVSFLSTTATGATIADWKYTGRSVPKAGDERARINLWLHGGAPPTDGNEVEVVLSGFTFTGAR